MENFFFVQWTLRLTIDGNAMDVDGDSLKTSLKIFFRFFTLFVISFVPT